MRKIVSFAVALIIPCWLALFATVAAQTQQSAPPDHTIFTPAAIQWKDGPAALPPGAKFAVLEGDPAKEGPFTLRISFPAGYKILAADVGRQAALLKKPLKHGKSTVFFHRGESFAGQQITAGMIGDSQRVAILTIPQQELAFVAGAPQFIGSLA